MANPFYIPPQNSNRLGNILDLGKLGLMLYDLKQRGDISAGEQALKEREIGQRESIYFGRGDVPGQLQIEAERNRIAEEANEVNRRKIPTPPAHKLPLAGVGATVIKANLRLLGLDPMDKNNPIVAKIDELSKDKNLTRWDALQVFAGDEELRSTAEEYLQNKILKAQEKDENYLNTQKGQRDLDLIGSFADPGKWGTGIKTMFSDTINAYTQEQRSLEAAAVEKEAEAVLKEAQGKKALAEARGAGFIHGAGISGVLDIRGETPTLVPGTAMGKVPTTSEQLALDKADKAEQLANVKGVLSQTPAGDPNRAMTEELYYMQGGEGSELPALQPGGRPRDSKLLTPEEEAQQIRIAGSKAKETELAKSEGGFKDWTPEAKEQTFMTNVITGKPPVNAQGLGGNDRKAYGLEYAQWQVDKNLKPGDIALMQADYRAGDMSLKNMSKQEAPMNAFVANINKQISKIEELYSKGDRTGIRLLDLPVRELKVRALGSGDEAVKASYLLEISNEIGKLSSGASASVQQLSDSAKEDWKKVHDPNLSFKEIMKVVNATRDQANMRLSTWRQAKEEVRSSLRGLGGVDVPVPQISEPQPPSPLGLDINAIQAELNRRKGKK